MLLHVWRLLVVLLKDYGRGCRCSFYPSWRPLDRAEGVHVARVWDELRDHLVGGYRGGRCGSLGSRTTTS